MLPNGNPNTIEELFAGWTLKEFTQLRGEKVFILEKRK